MSKQLEFQDAYKWWPDNKVVSLEELEMILKAIRWLMENKPEDAYQYTSALIDNVKAVRRELNQLVKDVSKYIPDEVEKENIQLTPGTQERVPGGN